jgi:hypothetical protein
MDNFDLRSSQNDFRNYLPFSREMLEDLVEVGGGNVQRTFISNKYGVIHTLPLENISDTDLALISNRWIMKGKPQLLANIQKQAPTTNKVNVPQVQAFGNFEYREQSYSFWVEDYVPGDTLLERTFTLDLFQDYEDLIVWSDRLHQETQNEMSIRNYYSARIQALKGIFTKENPLINVVGLEFSTAVSRILEKIAISIPNCVWENESVSIIHGDMRSKNIIFYGNIKWVIDFEQGVNGGDWFYDIEKLLMLTNIQLPNNNKPYTYRPPLTIDQKSKLVKRYMDVRSAQGWLAPKFLEDYVQGQTNEIFLNRRRLFDIDNDLSQLVHNYVRGWNFFTRQGQFHEQKGVLYLKDKFIRDHIN